MNLTTPIKQTVHCPNCGSYAERQYLIEKDITTTQCPSCDYLMVNTSSTGQVMEAYAPGINPFLLLEHEKPATVHKRHLLPTHGSSGR